MIADAAVLEDPGTVNDLASQLDPLYKENCWEWLCREVKTIDEAEQCVKRWPRDREDLRELLQFIETEPKLAIPKSRRMMASWLVAAYCLHRVRYFPNYAIYIQSETEAKAAYLVDKRCAFMENNLASEFRRPFKSWRTVKDGLIGRMEFEPMRGESASYLLAIAEGGDVIRTFTPSVLVLDESEFQQRGHDALVAAMSTVEKKAKIIMLSSSNGPLGVMAGIARQVGFERWTG